MSSKGPKYKYGDKVIVRGHDGKIISARKAQSGNYIYTVKFDNPNLIPSELDYLEHQIEENTNDETHCPVCKTKWNVVKFNMNVWKDCLRCQETSEKIIENNKNKLLKDFEKMLDEDQRGYNWYNGDDDIF